MSAIGPGTRVKCVFRGPWTAFGYCYPGPAFGSVWTVGDVHFVRGCGGPWLDLSEWTDGSWFHASLFRPLDGDDEVERMQRAALEPHDPDRTLTPLVPARPEEVAFSQSPADGGANNVGNARETGFRWARLPWMNVGPVVPRLSGSSVGREAASGSPDRVGPAPSDMGANRC